MNNLVEIAETFIGANEEVKKGLFEYYNNHCFDLVKPERRYRIQPDDDWCAMFVSVVAHLAGYSKHIFPYEVSVREQVRISELRAMYFEGGLNASQNDLVIYDWLGNGTFDHVGIVVEVGNRYLTVIEGNKGDTVDYRTIRLNSKAVRGFIKLTPSTPLPENERLQTIAKDVLKGRYGNGNERRVKLGKDYQAVQKIVNELL